MTRVICYPTRPLRWSNAFRRWPTGLNYSLYLPPGCESVEALFRRGNLSQAISELIRLSREESHAAKSVVAFLHLQGAIGDGIDFDKAEQLVETSAATGDAFALYVKGWIWFLRDKKADQAVECWAKGADQGFAPSMLECARFLLWDLPDKPPRPLSAYRGLEHAARLNHKQAPALATTIARCGSLGWARAIRGWICALPATISYAWWLRSDPFSDCVFSRPLVQKRPYLNSAGAHKREDVNSRE